MSIRLVPLFAATLALGLAGCGQFPTGHAAHHTNVSAPAPGQAMSMARLDEHMQNMRAVHDRLVLAKTPEERNALMAEHSKLMQDGMALMGGMGPGGRAGMDRMGQGGMGGMMGMEGPGSDPAARQQMMEKRMDMMQSMMQMMMDRLPPPATRP